MNTNLLDAVNSMVEVRLSAADLGALLERAGRPRTWAGLAEALAAQWNAEVALALSAATR